MNEFLQARKAMNLAYSSPNMNPKLVMKQFSKVMQQQLSYSFVQIKSNFQSGTTNTYYVPLPIGLLIISPSS